MSSLLAATMRNHMISLFLLLSLLELFASSSTSTSSKLSDCKPSSYLCGGHDCNISYPYRVPGMPNYCGHPAFELSCKNNNTKRSMLAMKISGREYKVKDIYYDDRVISLVNPDSLGETCPRSFSNITVDHSLFNYTDYDINMTLFFNCTQETSRFNLRSITCPGSDDTTKSLYNSYYILPQDPPPQLAEMSKNCGAIVQIPMFDSDAGPLARGRLDFLGVLQNGFDLNWMVGDGWCKACEDSSGVCGRDVDVPERPVCFCPDGSTTGSACGKS